MQVQTDLAVAIVGILGALVVGAMSPGPSFVFVARTAVSRSRGDGIAAAFGMGVGGLVFAGLAILGLRTVINEFGALYGAFKVLGGLYLLVLAVALWRSHDLDPQLTMRPPASERHRIGRSFSLGLATQLSNPKPLSSTRASSPRSCRRQCRRGPPPCYS